MRILLCHTGPRRFQLCCHAAWLSLCLLLLGAGPWALAQTPTVEAPKPAPADRSQLPTVFTRSSPASLADLRMMERHVKDLAARTTGTVVAIEFGSTTGSGVVVSPDGLVLTAGHVVGRGNRPVSFRFPDGKTVRGKTLGLDSASDTGVMQITDAGPWPFAPLGDLKGAQTGDWVLAMGHPGGFDSRRSTVVRLGRIIRLSPDMLQTDCTITHGDSGGPLFDMHGRVIAIHNEISGSMSGNFHVPTTVYYKAWNRLIAGDMVIPRVAELVSGIRTSER